MDGGSRVANVLLRQGVKFVFALAGGHISPILVAAKKAGIRVIDVRDEANAAFAADAMSRLTGTPGVAAVTAGPGIANTLTAIKNAQLAQSPLVLLGGATATLLKGRGALQDIDQLEMIRPHVKYCARPTRLGDVVPALEEAFRVATSGVPGPTFVELAVDLLYPEATVREWYKNKTDKPNPTLSERGLSLYIRGHLKYLFFESGLPPIPKPPAHPHHAGTVEEIRKAAEMLQQAKRPLMVLGSQTMLHPPEAASLVKAIEKLGVPVYLSGMARGLLGKQHPLQFRHKRRNALKEADVILLSGVPADFRLDYGSHLSRAKVIGVNLSRQDLNLNRKPELGIVGDPHEFLLALGRESQPHPPREEWFDSLRRREAEREEEIDKMASEPSERLNPLRLCKAIERKLSDKSILVGDGGDFVATASYILQPRGPCAWLDPGVFGTLGVGAGFALAAKLVHPDADVWLLYGDGAAGFSMMEYDTFVRHKVPVISVIGNDAGWTQIARDQVTILGDDVACRLEYTNYHQVAEGLGAVGYKVSAEDQVESVLDNALKSSREGSPVVVNALLDRSDFRKGSISILRFPFWRVTRLVKSMSPERL